MVLATLVITAKAQTGTVEPAMLPVPATKPAPQEELKWNLSPDGNRYWKVTFLNQTWLRFNQSNPGTLVLGEKQDNTFDIGLRRTRIQMYGKVAPRTFLYFQFGQNNFNFLSANAGNRKLQPFFHDAVAEFEVFENKNWLKLGSGLTMVNGLSRFSQPSIGTIMTMDVPVFAQATVDQTDEFSRKLSVYARGQAGHWDYRFAYSDPFPLSSNGTTVTTTAPSKTIATFANAKHRQQLQGYLMYQFFEQESHITPGYMTGTYLGKKKIFNIAGGIISQQNAMWRQGDSLVVSGKKQADTAFSPMNLWCVESFLDLPLNQEKGTAISAYIGYFNFDYGPGYLRFNGIMNPANGSSYSGARTGTINTGGAYGNAYPMFGTGSAVYAQIGYLCPANMLGEGVGTLMPYVSFTNGNYARLDKPAQIYNAGVNWLLSGHKSKITLNYENRPAYIPTDAAGTGYQFDSRKSAFIIQYQVFI